MENLDKNNIVNESENTDNDNIFKKTTTNVIKSMCGFRYVNGKYKALKIIWAIIMIPFFISALAVFIGYIAVDFLYSMIAYPLKRFTTSINKDSLDVPVKVVIYLCAYPFIVSCKVFLFALDILLYLSSFLINLFAFIYSIGAIKFQSLLCNTL